LFLNQEGKRGTDKAPPDRARNRLVLRGGGEGRIRNDTKEWANLPMKRGGRRGTANAQTVRTKKKHLVVHLKERSLVLGDEKNSAHHKGRERKGANVDGGKGGYI